MRGGGWRLEDVGKRGRKWIWRTEESTERMEGEMTDKWSVEDGNEE